MTRLQRMSTIHALKDCDILGIGSAMTRLAQSLRTRSAALQVLTKMDKKASSISINTVIVAAIALIVLVVLVLIFTGRIGIFSWAVKGCSSQKGVCATGAIQDTNAINSHQRYRCGDDYAEIWGTDCDKDKNDNIDYACCIPLYPDLTPTP